MPNGASLPAAPALGPAACTVNRAAMSDLLLKRATAAVGEVYDVIYEDKIVGRIMFSAPSVDPWAWMLTYDHHEDRSPIDGYEPSRDAAMQAFASSWHREK